MKHGYTTRDNFLPSTQKLIALEVIFLFQTFSLLIQVYIIFKIYVAIIHNWFEYNVLKLKEVEEVNTFEENIALKKTVFKLLHASLINPKASSCWVKTILKWKVQTWTFFLRIYLSQLELLWNYEYLDKNGCIT